MQLIQWMVGQETYSLGFEPPLIESLFTQQTVNLCFTKGFTFPNPAQLLD